MTANLESLGRLRLQGILLLIVIFVIGALVGAAFERTRKARPKPPPPERHGEALPPGFIEELRLTREQADSIKVILDANRPRTDAVLAEFLPRLAELTDSIRAEVRGVLTPEQQEILDERQPRLGPPIPGEQPPHGGPPPAGGPPHGAGRPPRGHRPPPGGHPPPGDAPPQRDAPPPPDGGR
jgi:hypothetical protein